MVAPTGGDKDETPPEVVGSQPENGATRFNTSTVVIEFNEFIRLDNLQQKLIVSPALATMPQVKVKKKSLWIYFPSAPESNTTYTLNFGDAIRDMTEGNAISSFTYVFSTGDVLDSLNLKGTLKDAYKGDAQEQMLVMLYNGTGDSLPYKSKPRYFTRTAADGSYTLSNLREGNYILFALDDRNGNYLFDQPSERIAFYDSTVVLPTDHSVSLRMFTEPPEKPRLLEASMKRAGHLTLIFNMPVSDVNWQNMNEEVSVGRVIPGMIGTDTLSYWLPEMDAEHLTISVSAKGMETDTVKLKTSTISSLAVSERFTPLQLSAGQTGKPMPGDVLSITSSHPVRTRNPDLITLWNDAQEKTTVEVKKDTTQPNTMAVTAPWHEGTSYLLEVMPGAFTDIMGFTNDTLRYRFTGGSLEDLGKMTVQLTIQDQKGDWILQVVDARDRVIRSQKGNGSGKVVFDKVIPAEYKLQLIMDVNGNGRWDSGEYRVKRLPEPMIHYPEKITIRANWESEWIWDVGPVPK